MALKLKRPNLFPVARVLPVKTLDFPNLKGIPRLINRCLLKNDFRFSVKPAISDQ